MWAGWGQGGGWGWGYHAGLSAYLSCSLGPLNPANPQPMSRERLLQKRLPETDVLIEPQLVSEVGRLPFPGASLTLTTDTSGPPLWPCGLGAAMC